MYKTIVISLGGSLVAPEAGRVDIAYLKKFRALVLKHVKQGNRFAIIVGGGKLARIWQEAGVKLGVKSKEDLDWIGIRATHANMELVRAMFGKNAYSHVIIDPAEKVGHYKIIFGAGYKPGSSSDYDTVVRAKTIGAKTIINLSPVAYVYDKNPKKFKNAKPLPYLTWQNYFKIIGKKWLPGGNYPFDPVASLCAQKAKLKVVVLNGRNFKNLENFLLGKKFKGTVIQG